MSCIHLLEVVLTDFIHRLSANCKSVVSCGCVTDHICGGVLEGISEGDIRRESERRITLTLSLYSQCEISVLYSVSAFFFSYKKLKSSIIFTPLSVNITVNLLQIDGSLCSSISK